jgi:NADPH:quinone reductase-like Zn-dependent oxidoreductase
MKAFAIAARDAGPEFQELPDPQPASGEVVVAVQAASLNGIDAAVASGAVWDFMPHSFPVVLGRDFAGAVVALGEGVDDVAVGDRVAGTLSPLSPLGPAGTFGEFAAVPIDTVAPIPDGLDSATAAALGLAGVTALDLLDGAAVEAGDVVFVSGATGGVGHLAVQLAAARGATVIATTAPGREETMRAFGAIATVDYTGDIVTQLRSIAPGGVDKVIHSAGDVATVAAAVRPGGTLASALGATAEQAGRDDIEVVAIVNHPTGGKLADLLARVADGSLRPLVAATIPFEDAAAALEAFRSGKLGKIVVTR